MSLYGKDARYTLDATCLDNQTHEALHEIFRRFVDAGHSPREVSHIMQAAVSELEHLTVLGISDNIPKLV